MRQAQYTSLLMALAGIFLPFSVRAQGILPDRINQVTLTKPSSRGNVLI